jgi:ABC-type phosphate transport system auxiliary subunit
MSQELAAATDRIETLLARLERGDQPDRARVDDTLTEGYACALSLDAECDRLERRLSQHAARLGPDSTLEDARELSTLARRLAHRRNELESLRERLAMLRAAQPAKVA